MKTATERKRKERAAKKAQGLSKLELWINPKLHHTVRGYAMALQQHQSELAKNHPNDLK